MNVWFLILFIIGYVFFNSNSKKIYTVTFDSQGGNEIKQQEIAEGEMVLKLTDPIKKDYVFVEWQLDGEVFDFSVEIDKDITLKAKWVKKETDKEMITVKFDSDGGTTIVNQILETMGKVTKPKDPIKKGYTFEGWYLNSKIYNFDSIVKEDITLKANWKKEEVKKEEKKVSIKSTNRQNNPTNNTPSNKPAVKKYTVSFNSNGGSAVSSKTVTE